MREGEGGREEIGSVISVHSNEAMGEAMPIKSVMYVGM